jgi:hypothetical protein
MSTAVIDRPVTAETSAASVAPVVAVKRRTIDKVLIGIGVVATAVFAVAGALLMWGHNFASNYVGDELSSQHITFPQRCKAQRGRPHRPGQVRRSQARHGKEAEGYASYINGHLQGIAKGATYADLGAVESAAKADVKAAVDAASRKQPSTSCRPRQTASPPSANTLVQGRDLARPAVVGLRLVNGRHDRWHRRHRRFHRRRHDGNPLGPRDRPLPQDPKTA